MVWNGWSSIKEKYFNKGDVNFEMELWIEISMFFLGKDFVYYLLL